jgi:hypothetical protein
MAQACRTRRVRDLPAILSTALSGLEVTGRALRTFVTWADLVAQP